MQADIALGLVEALAAFGVIIASAELLYVSAEYERGGMLSTRIASRFRVTNAGRRASGWLGRVVVRPAVVRSGLAVRLAAAVGILPALVVARSLVVWILAVMVAATLAIHYAMLFGLNASDHMMLVVLGGAVVAEVGVLFDNDPLLFGGLGFIAAQSGLSYFTAGLTKLAGSAWRSGLAVRAIIDTNAFGQDRVSDVLNRHSGLGAAATYAVVAFEVAFPVVFFLPNALTISYVVAGVILHLGIAAVMGLNLFLWAFVATYPAVVYISCRV